MPHLPAGTFILITFKPFIDVMLYFASISISLYLLLLFIGKPNKTVADKLLMIWQLIATLHLVDLYLSVSGYYRAWPAVLGWGAPFPLVHGPFLYLYILYLTTSKKPDPKSLFHFLPVALACLVWLPFSLLKPALKLSLYEEGMLFYQTQVILYNIAIAVSGVVYVAASCVLLYRYKRRIGQLFSTTDAISLNWLRYLIAGIGMIWLLVIFYPTPQSIYMGASLYICFIGFFGVRQKQIFNTPTTGMAFKTDTVLTETPRVTADLLPPAPEPAPVHKTKYGWSALTEEDAAQVFVLLQEVMVREQLYKNAELTLDELASALQVQDAVLSQVINSRCHQSFYDYINSLRVAEFIKLAADPKNEGYTLLSIAFDCGFNSKSSFNRNFRKFTGQSPSDYLKENKRPTGHTTP